jgi:HD-GYP domain-containing protein (c-di-GMP phosphodiesterase class II)
MAIFKLEDPIDNEMFYEAYDEFLEQYTICESSIVALEHSPEDSVLLNDLFRTIHTVKANASMLSFEPMVLILQELETILDLVRSGGIPFSNLAGDLTLLLMDRSKNFMEQYKKSQEVEYPHELYNLVQKGLQKLAKSKAADVSMLMVDIIQVLDPNTTLSSKPLRSSLEELTHDNNDLKFLYQLAKSCEERVGYWKGRTDRIGQLALAMNLEAGNPVDVVNLAASLFTHDIAMAFLPEELLTQQQKLNDKQQTLVRHHVQISSQLMRSMFSDHTAGINLMQHQEMLNGKGYPNGLSGNDISAGAKIIAIVHTFEAITHGHTSTTLHKRPLMRALLEINKKAGIEFSERWVDVFMRVVPNLY